MYKEPTFWRDKYGDLKIWVISLLVCGAIGTLLAIGVYCVGNFYEKPACEKKADQMGLEWDWGYYTGCMVQTDAGWVELDRFRSTESTNR